MQQKKKVYVYLLSPVCKTSYAERENGFLETVPKMSGNKSQIIITAKLQPHKILEMLANISFTVVSSVGALAEHLRHTELKFMAINMVFNYIFIFQQIALN
jgi:hypothetical protein